MMETVKHNRNLILPNGERRSPNRSRTRIPGRLTLSLPVHLVLRLGRVLTPVKTFGNPLRISAQILVTCTFTPTT